jgi:hypothetical protein
LWDIYDPSYNEFTLAFDEGNDGNHGSGSRDYTLTNLQEDLKTWASSQVLHDGYFNSSWYGTTTEIDFVANATHEIEHFPDASEIEYWEGLSWMDDHWESEFSIPFVGNDTGITDVSDLTCSILDTIGIKIQYFYQPATNCYYPQGGLMEVNTYADLSFPPPIIESCNITGDAKDYFNLHEDVYVNGGDFSPLTTHDFYIVNDVATWTDGMAIPTRVAGTATTINTDSDGNVALFAAWSDPPTNGLFDIIVDVNGNGHYDLGIDALDSDDVEVSAGFMIPEYASLLAILLLSMVAILSTVAVKKKHPT